MFGQQSGVIEPAGNRVHAGGLLMGMHVNPHAVMLQHGHKGFAQLRVEVIRIGIHKIKHFLHAAADGPGQAAVMCRRIKLRDVNRGNLRPWAIPKIFSSNQRICLLLSARFSRRTGQTAQCAQQVEMYHRPLGKGQAVGGNVGPFAFPHYPGISTPADIPAGHVAMHA